MAEHISEQGRVEISAAQYNTWLNPIEVLGRLKPLLSPGEAKAEIYRRLCNGELLSVVRTSNWYDRNDVRVRAFTILGANLWGFNHAPRDHDLLWKTGSHTLQWEPSRHYSARFDVQCFGIRFDPAGIDRILTDAGFTPHQMAPDTPTEPTTDIRKPPAKAELERFCRAILAGWGGELTQDWAFEKAVLFFPEHKVARDHFRSILRSIRGPTKPGKRGKTTE